MALAPSKHWRNGNREQVKRIHMESRTDKLIIISPADGDMLHRGDRIAADGSFVVQVKASAPEGSRLQVNGRPMTESKGQFSADLELPQYRNQIRMENLDSGEIKTITCYRLDHFEGKYRLSIDDNIWFLRDLTRDADKNRSLFDNPYMGSLKELHDDFGTKIHLNIFYQTEGFDLSEMTDKYKSEWIANAGWLRLSFHALQEFPDKPYQRAGYDQVEKDCNLVMNEVRRFAGVELTGPVTTVHWGEITVEGSRALRDAGYRGQLGYFNVDDDLPAVSYYLGVEQRRHIKKRFVWKDMREDIVFIKTSIVIDTKKKDEIIPHLEQYKKAGGKPPYLDLLVHEQYYYRDYMNYQPDYFEKLRLAIQWAVDNGYTPAFLKDCLFE